MKKFFFYNFSGRNLPDYSRKDFDTMHVVNGMIKQTGFQMSFPDDGSIGGSAERLGSLGELG